MSDPESDTSALGRRLLRSRDSGVLSTLSRELPGYPFGSVTPYVLTHTGELAFYVSTIAQHTKNLVADPRTSLIALEEGAGNRQALARVTAVGDGTRVPEEALESVAARYFRFFPEAEAYEGSHDFAFFWIRPQRVRYIGGFGKIFWIEEDEWYLAPPAWTAEEQAVLDHMNDDHADAVARMAEGAGLAGASARLIAIDPEGTHVRSGEGIAYVPFDGPAMDVESLRARMVALARN